VATVGRRADLKRRAARAGLRRRFVPHQLRHAHALELAHEGVPLNVIRRQLGHRNPGVGVAGSLDVRLGDRRRVNARR